MPSPGQDVRLRMIVPPPLLPQVASATLLLNLQADALALSDGDPVGIWTDQSGNGYDFTASGSAQPTFKVNTSGSYVKFDGIDDFMEGPNFADNLPSFAMFAVLSIHDNAQGWSEIIIGKIQDTSAGQGWAIYGGSDFFLLQENGGTTYLLYDTDFPHDADRVYLVEELLPEWTTLHTFLDGVSQDFRSRLINNGTPSSISNSKNVRMGTSHDPLVDGYFQADYRAVMLYAPTPNDTDRVAIEGWLMAKYGI